jgi:hypothetical protein
VSSESRHPTNCSELHRDPLWTVTEVLEAGAYALDQAKAALLHGPKVGELSNVTPTLFSVSSGQVIPALGRGPEHFTSRFEAARAPQKRAIRGSA